MRTLLGCIAITVSMGMAVIAASLNVAMFADTTHGHVLILLCAMSATVDVLKLITSYLAGDALSNRQWRSGACILAFALVLCLWSAMTTSSAWRTLSSGAHEAGLRANAEKKLKRKQDELGRLPEARPTGAVRAEISKLENEHMAGRVDCVAMAAVRKSCGHLAMLRVELENGKARESIEAEIKPLQSDVDAYVGAKPKRDFVADTLEGTPLANWSGWIVAALLELVCIGASALGAHAFATRAHVTHIDAVHIAQPSAVHMTHRKPAAVTQQKAGKQAGETDVAYGEAEPSQCVHMVRKGAQGDAVNVVRTALATCTPDGEGWRILSQRSLSIAPATTRRALRLLQEAGEIQLNTGGRVTRVKLLSKPQLQVVRS